MLETLSRETLTTQESGSAVLPEVQHRVLVHRPRSPQPALRRPSAPPPSERSVAAQVRVLASGRPITFPPAPPALQRRLRLTRRGRLVLLATFITLLFVAFSAGRVMSNASPAGPAKAVTHTVVVAPGDTAWSIAHAAMPHLDGRDAVDRLLALNHSDGRLRIGETLVVPGS